MTRHSYLAIEASTERCSVAVKSDDQTVVREQDIPRTHAQSLLPFIDEALDEASLRLADLDGIVVGIGPGAFTGIRIGMSVAQGLAYGANKTLVGIPSLLTMAQAALLSSQNTSLTNAVLLPMLDARMGEIYYAGYTCNEGLLDAFLEPQVCAPASLNEKLNGLSRPIVALGHGWFVDGIDQTLFSGHQESLLPNAVACLSLIDHPKAKKVDGRHAHALEPLYLRNEIAWEKRQRIRST